MKKILFLLFFGFSISISCIYAQEETLELPAISIKDLRGASVSSGDFQNGGKPIVICFWATWTKPSIQELIAISEQYEDLVEETGVKIIAISIDDARNAPKVSPFVEGKGWEYEVYIDENSDFKRAMSVNNIPHTFLLNGNKQIVWNHNSYTPGDEEELYNLVRKLAKDGSLE